MNLNTLHGVIRRRILINFRVDPKVMQIQLPPPFRPKLLDGWAVAGICLIRLEQLRPRGLPALLGRSSENAAHRIAVVWTDERGEAREGVYIPRRDSGAWLNRLVGGRLFPGEHQRARFSIREESGFLEIVMDTEGGVANVRLRARVGDRLPSTSRFASLEDASQFFAAGAVGYSPARNRKRLDGLRMQAENWHVEPLEVVSLHSAYFSDPSRFPVGSVTFDDALIMRDIEHEWQMVPDISRCDSTPGSIPSSTQECLR